MKKRDLHRMGTFSNKSNKQKFSWKRETYMEWERQEGCVFLLITYDVL